MKKVLLMLVTLSLVFFVRGERAFAAKKDKCVDECEKEIYTPKPKPSPRINSAMVYGCRPGNPFLYRIPCQGDRPIRFSVKKLPDGLILDSATGIISGITPVQGEYEFTIKAINSKGKDKKNFKIISGEKLALTPPMGWNHWYAHYTTITDKIVREAADKIINSGMADVGYQFVNIDDGWMNAEKHADPRRVGELRNEDGKINSNYNFPNMKGLTDYIHSYGLKAGIYTSPGTKTCAGFVGSYGHEELDAARFAEWGFDFLKYDWCSYGYIANGGSKDDPNIPNWCRAKTDLTKEEYIYPYKKMGDILKKQNRDIVYNICQIGMGEVWKWGGEAGGNCWRTANDLGFELDRIFDVAINNAKLRQYNKPGEWNDPDYIQIGWIGNAIKKGNPELTTMPATMQYAYMSLWSLMAAPLIYSGDVSKLDEFTLNVLCNPEVIEVNQDPLGECGRVIKKTDNLFLMVKNLADGSIAVGLFNRGKTSENMEVNWEELNISGKYKIRDLWHQKDLGAYKQKITLHVPMQGVVMIRMYKR